MLHSCRRCSSRRNRDLTLKYGIGIEEYDALLEKQSGVCAICKQQESTKTKQGKAKALAVDHNHSTGQVRGLLCSRCNRAFGAFAENPMLLVFAAAYAFEHAQGETKHETEKNAAHRR